MDMFEKFLARRQQQEKSANKLRSAVAYDLEADGETEAEMEAILSSEGRTLGGRPGIKPGTKFNFIRVIGQHIWPGRLRNLSKREYVVACIAPKPDGGICGKKFIATYHQIYYMSLYSCGCTTRMKHPPIRLEGMRIGVLEVLRWDDQLGWECVCRECGEMMYALKSAEVKALGMRCPPHRKAS